MRLPNTTLVAHTALLHLQVARIELQAHQLVGREFNLASPAQVGEQLRGLWQKQPRAR